MFYQSFFDLFTILLRWLTNPTCTTMLLLGLSFGLVYRLYRWF